MKIILRYLFGITALVLLCVSIDLKQSFELIKRVQILELVIAFIIMVLIRLIMALRFHWFVRTQTSDISYTLTIKTTFIGMFLGQFLPGGVGPDLVRATLLSQNKKGIWKKITLSTFLDRFVGVGSLLLFSLVASIVLQINESISAQSILGQHFIAIPAVLMVIWIAILQFAYMGNFSFTKVHESKIFRILERLHGAVYEQISHPQTLAKVFALSVVVQGLRCTFFYLLFLSLNQEVSFLTCVSFVPLVYLISLLPISVGGLGVREGALVLFFNLAGVAAEISVLVGLVYFLLHLVLSVPGAYFWLYPTGQGNKDE